MTLTIEDHYRRVAFHEAGHAIVGVALGHPVTRVTIDPRAPMALVGPRKTTVDIDEVRRHIAVNFAGYLAERRICSGERLESIRGANKDLVSIAAMAPHRCALVRVYLPKASHWRAFLREQVRLSSAVLRANWPLVGDLAEVLLQKTTVKGRGLTSFIERTQPWFLRPSTALMTAFESMRAA